MAHHPLNLILRFALELAALFAYAYSGWILSAGNTRLFWAIGAPLMAALIWGTFRVEGDPGKAPVAVPGILRLLIEMTFFGGAVIGLLQTRLSWMGWGFAAVSIIHYLISYDRVWWLLKR